MSSLSARARRMAATQTQAVIPPELVDHILDTVFTECKTGSVRKVLSSCSLVCKTWLPRSSCHLLRAAKVSEANLKEFLAFAKTSTRLPTHIYQLTIDGTIDPTIHLEDIYATIPKLDRLELRDNNTVQFVMPPDFELGLEDIDDEGVIKHYIQATGNRRAVKSGKLSIDGLKLSRVNMMSIPLFIRPFRHVRTLELVSIDYGTRFSVDRITLDPYEASKAYLAREVGHVLPLPAPVEVDHLIYNGASHLMMGAGLTTFPLRPTTLTVRDVDRKVLLGLLGFMRDGGGNLERLTLIPRKEFPDSRDPDDEDDEEPPTPPDHIMLLPDSCPKLSSVDFSVVDVRAGSKCCSTILWYLPADTVRKICITLRSRELLEVLPDLRTAFRAKDYSNLETLELRGLGNGRALPPGIQANTRVEVQAHIPDGVNCGIVLS